MRVLRVGVLEWSDVALGELFGGPTRLLWGSVRLLWGLKEVTDELRKVT